MSLFVALRCRDGIVLGGDDAANFGTTRRHTIRSAFRKVRVVDNRVGLCVAGTTGVMQQYEDVLTELVRSGEFDTLRPVQAMNVLRDSFMKSSAAQFQVAAAVLPGTSDTPWRSSAAEALVALDIGGAYHLFHYDAMLCPEEVPLELPFISIGTGQATADPFIAHLQHIYFEREPPDLPLGIMTALWTLKHATDTGAEGVGNDRQIITFQWRDGVPLVEDLTVDQLQEHYEFIGRIEASMRQLKNAMAPAKEPTKLPTPPGKPESTT